MLVSDRRWPVYQHLPTLCRISAVMTNVMSFCNGNLRRIFIANTELSLFFKVSRHFLKAYYLFACFQNKWHVLAGPIRRY